MTKPPMRVATSEGIWSTTNGLSEWGLPLRSGRKITLEAISGNGRREKPRNIRSQNRSSTIIKVASSLKAPLPLRSSSATSCSAWMKWRSACSLRASSRTASKPCLSARDRAVRYSALFATCRETMPLRAIWAWRLASSLVKTRTFWKDSRNSTTGWYCMLVWEWPPPKRFSFRIRSYYTQNCLITSLNLSTSTKEYRFLYFVTWRLWKRMKLFKAKERNSFRLKLSLNYTSIPICHSLGISTLENQKNTIWVNIRKTYCPKIMEICC